MEVGNIAVEKLSSARLEIAGVSVRTRTGALLLDDVSLSIERGDIEGLTGASGSGKTTLVRTVMGMLGIGCFVVSGGVGASGRDLLALGRHERRAANGRVVGLVPQNPMTAFDGDRTVGSQMSETFHLRLGLSRTEACDLAVEQLEQVHLGDVSRVMRSYPDQLSGGMLQRAAVALTLGLEPDFILADEPTSALDADNREAIMELVATAPGKPGVLLVSHDPHALRTWCRTVSVMAGGRVVEAAPPSELFKRPIHAWTKAFVHAIRAQDEGEWAWTA